MNSKDVEQLYEQLNGLSEAEKSKIRSLLGININIFFCGSAAVNNSVSLQVNDRDSLKEALANVPPEVWAEILKIIAQWVSHENL